MMPLVALLQGIAFCALAAVMHGAPVALKRHVAAHRGPVRGGGWMLLLLSFVMALVAAPFGLAVLHWCGLATVTAAAVLLVCTALHSRQRRRTGRA